jgi:hypothetical protein
MSITLAIPDLHSPWLHRKAVPFLERLKTKFRPTTVVMLGDEVENHRQSRHPQETDVPGPGDELFMARKALQPVFDLFTDVLVCESNHGQRPRKRAKEAGIPAEMLRSPGEVLGAPPGWKWADWHDVDGVHFRHGDGFSGKYAALRAVESLRRNVVIGHVHAHAAIHYLQGPFDHIWGVNAGALLDPDAPVFRYGKYLTTRPWLGACVIVDGVPHLLPLD